MVQRVRCVAAPVSLKSERKISDRKVDVSRAHEHPTATGPITGHATAIRHALEPPSPSPWGSRATQTATSASACYTRTSEVETGRRVHATHKLLHHETSCSQLDHEPKHAAKQLQPEPFDEICPEACHPLT